VLKGYAALDGESPAAAREIQAQEREIETQRVRRSLSARKLLGVLPWPHGGTATGVVLRWTQRAIALRERARLKQSLLYSRCRRVILRIGEELAARGVLGQTEDVFMLTHQELDALLSGGLLLPGACGALVALRRRELERISRLAPPESMALPRGAWFTGCVDDHAVAPADDRDVLTGTGACGGTVTARATVLADVTESGRLHPGDILVARQTDPGWAPLFFMVRGLVMERGGMLSHAAIIAREYGIPTVVGVRGATTRITSGKTVTIDGDAGSVRLLD
jgi:pyruvate,water dikinase